MAAVGDAARAYINAQYRGGRPLCPHTHTTPFPLPPRPTSYPNTPQMKNSTPDPQLPDTNLYLVTAR